MGRLLIISGDDDFARKQRAREAASMLTGSDEPENAEIMEIIQGDLPELKPDVIAGRFLEALRTPPFLSPEKIVWMRHHPDLDGWTGEKVSPVVRELTDCLLSELPGEIGVLIDGPGVDKRKVFYRNLQKKGAEIEIFSVSRATDRNFAETRRNVLNEFAKSTGKRLSAEAMQYLTEVIGGDSGILANELNKLACYTGNAKQITVDDCRAIVSRTPEAVVWEYTEAIQRGQCERALRDLALLNSHAEPGSEIRLLAALSNTFQRALELRSAMRELGIGRPTPSSPFTWGMMS